MPVRYEQLWMIKGCGTSNDTWVSQGVQPGHQAGAISIVQTVIRVSALI